MLEALRVDVPALGIAGEFCWHDALWRELDEHTWARFTHTVGSLHAVTLPDGRWLHMFASRWPAGLDVDAYMDAHVASLERFAARCPSSCSPTPRCCPIPLRERPLEELWTEAREARAVAALARAGIAFEVSNRYRPHARFVGARRGRGRAPVARLRRPLARAGGRRRLAARHGARRRRARRDALRPARPRAARRRAPRRVSVRP
jgi:hypothetical protein